MKYKNIFYFRHINDIGGIETFFWHMARKYGKTHDITVFYNTGAWAQIHRLRKYVRVVQLPTPIPPTMKIECEKAFFNFNLDILDNVIADEKIQIAHGDYKSMKVTPNTDPRIDRYLGISKIVCETYEEVTGHKTELVYNPFIPPEKKNIMHLISATRLSYEKGGKRMEYMQKKLDESGIPYIWTIYTTDKPRIKSPNVFYREPRLDIVDYISDADYLVQLSDNEGYCYSVVEALSVGTQVIVTDCPVFREIGVCEDNGFILPFDMRIIPIEQMYERVCKKRGYEFDWKAPEDRWGEILAPGEPTYLAELEQDVLIVAKNKYIDMELGRVVMPGETYTVSKARADVLISGGMVEISKEN